MLDKSTCQVRDLCHKAPVQVARECPGALCSVGEPFNEAAPRQGRVQAQQVSAAGTRKISGQLDDKTAGDKTAGALTGDEAYRAQTGPVCGRRSKHGRIYRCPKWGTTAPRDAIGAVNI